MEGQGFASGNAGLSNVKLKLSHQELATCREQDLSKSSWTRYCTLYLMLEQMHDSLSALVEESAASLLLLEHLDRCFLIEQHAGIHISCRYNKRLNVKCTNHEGVELYPSLEFEVIIRPEVKKQNSISTFFLSPSSQEENTDELKPSELQKNRFNRIIDKHGKERPVLSEKDADILEKLAQTSLGMMPIFNRKEKNTEQLDCRELNEDSELKTEEDNVLLFSYSNGIAKSWSYADKETTIQISNRRRRPVFVSLTKLEHCLSELDSLHQDQSTGSRESLADSSMHIPSSVESVIAAGIHIESVIAALCSTSKFRNFVLRAKWRWESSNAKVEEYWQIIDALESLEMKRIHELETQTGNHEENEMQLSRVQTIVGQIRVAFELKLNLQVRDSCEKLCNLVRQLVASDTALPADWPLELAIRSFEQMLSNLLLRYKETRLQIQEFNCNTCLYRFHAQLENALSMLRYASKLPGDLRSGELGPLWISLARLESCLDNLDNEHAGVDEGLTPASFEEVLRSLNSTPPRLPVDQIELSCEDWEHLILILDERAISTGAQELQTMASRAKLSLKLRREQLAKEAVHTIDMQAKASLSEGNLPDQLLNTVAKELKRLACKIKVTENKELQQSAPMLERLAEQTKQYVIEQEQSSEFESVSVPFFHGAPAEVPAEALSKSSETKGLLAPLKRSVAKTFGNFFGMSSSKSGSGSGSGIQGESNGSTTDTIEHTETADMAMEDLDGSNSKIKGALGETAADCKGPAKSSPIFKDAGTLEAAPSEGNISEGTEFTNLVQHVASVAEMQSQYEDVGTKQTLDLKFSGLALFMHPTTIPVLL